MKREQKQLLKLLKYAVQGKRIADIDKNIKWEKILAEAEAHKIKGLLYTTINQEEHIAHIPKEAWEEWKKETFITGVRQIKHVKQIGIILQEFEKERIPSIVLKGLVVRELYPRPELRSMCDADVLVYPKDLEKVEDIMMRKGYRIFSQSPIHTVYVHPQHLPVEIHWTLKHDSFFGQIESDEKQLWRRATPVKVGQGNSLSLGIEDLTMHLCEHMATHLSVGGFGIRQVADLALLVEKKGDQINWDIFCEQVRQWKLEKFVLTIFQVSQKVFDTKIPTQVNRLANLPHLTAQMMLEDIMAAGVHGKREAITVLGNELAKDLTTNKKGKENNVILNFLKFIFPPIDKLPKKYEYAKRYKILVPIAWSHHLISGIKNQDYSGKEKLKLICTGIFISRKRNKLLRNLEL